MILLRYIYLLLALLVSPHTLAAHEHEHPQHGARTPAGIMGEHQMAPGEWMLSYRFMRMSMQGNRVGTKRVATPLPGFMVSPLDMTMDMHMLGLMRGIDDELTLMLMLPALQIDMNHSVNSTGTRFRTVSSGLGDISLTAIYALNHDHLLLNAGLSIPTGSIDERHVIPASAGVPVQLPYPMQLGSGSYDLLLGLTRTGRLDHFHWGAQAQATLRTGHNDNGYTLGNIYQLSGWLSRKLGASLNISARLNARNQRNIDGVDTTLAVMPTVPTKNPELRGGSRIDLLLGLDWMIGKHVFAIELGVPLYQNLHGPQLEFDRQLNISWQSSF